MSLGDFIARLTGRKAEPEPAPTSRAPTTDDLLAALVRVEQLVANGAVPAVVASRVGRVVRVVRETIPRLGNLGGSAQAYSVMATATDYLPEAIGGGPGPPPPAGGHRGGAPRATRRVVPLPP